MATIYISPSTQERNIGYGKYGTEETRMNQIADVICKYLDDTEVKYYRNKPTMTATSSALDSNEKKPDIHFSIHSNAGGGTGPECLIYGRGGERERFAKIIYDKLTAIVPMKGRGIKEAPHLVELRRTTAPACLVEIAFHDRKEDAEWIMNNINLIGTELAKGICEYFGVTKKPSPAPTGTLYHVQVGAYGVKSNADAMAARLKKLGFDTIIKTSTK